MAGILGDIIGLARDIVDRIPVPDPEIRRAKLISRLTRRKVRLEAKLEKNPNNVEAKAALAGVVAELEQMEKADAASVPSDEGVGTDPE
jgi:hypothetical protein